MAFGLHEIIGFFNQWLDGLWSRFKPYFLLLFFSVTPYSLTKKELKCPETNKYKITEQ
jgi:hypothetical protein